MSILPKIFFFLVIKYSLLEKSLTLPKAIMTYLHNQVLFSIVMLIQRLLLGFLFPIFFFFFRGEITNEGREKDQEKRCNMWKNVMCFRGVYFSIIWGGGYCMCAHAYPWLSITIHIHPWPHHSMVPYKDKTQWAFTAPDYAYMYMFTPDYP